MLQKAIMALIGQLGLIISEQFLLQSSLIIYFRLFQNSSFPH
jgi:hypothetical protein